MRPQSGRPSSRLGSRSRSQGPARPYGALPALRDWQEAQITLKYIYESWRDVLVAGRRISKWSKSALGAGLLPPRTSERPGAAWLRSAKRDERAPPSPGGRGINQVEGFGLLKFDKSGYLNAREW